MAIISRPFDKDRVENREMAVLAYSLFETKDADMFIITRLIQGNNEPMSYDDLYRKAPDAGTHGSIAGGIMRIAHHGILNVIDAGDDDFKYLLSDGFLELANEIKTAVQSIPI